MSFIPLPVKLVSRHIICICAFITFEVTACGVWARVVHDADVIDSDITFVVTTTNAFEDSLRVIKQPSFNILQVEPQYLTFDILVEWSRTKHFQRRARERQKNILGLTLCFPWASFWSGLLSDVDLVAIYLWDYNNWIIRLMGSLLTSTFIKILLLSFTSYMKQFLFLLINIIGDPRNSRRGLEETREYIWIIPLFPEASFWSALIVIIQLEYRKWAMNWIERTAV